MRIEPVPRVACIIVLVLAVAIAALALGGCAPNAPSDALAEVDSVSGGDDMSCGHRRDATTWCWGDDALTDDILGRPYAKPVTAKGIVTTAKGGAQVCVVLEDRTVACRGGEFGLSGRPPSNARELGLTPMRGLTDVAQVGTGRYIDCVRRNDHTVACWGEYAEVLRSGTYDTRRRSGALDPHAHEIAEVHGLPPVVDLAVGSELALAIGSDGSAWTVGGLARGVGRVAGIDDAVKAASGDNFHCVLRRSGAVACWRDGFAIEPLAQVPTTPSPVENVAHARSIAAGAYGACALLEDGRAACWGRLTGEGKRDSPRWLDARVIPHADHVLALMVGSAHACGLREGGHVLCWGRTGALGIGASDENDRSARGLGYARTGADDTPDSKLRRTVMFLLALTLSALLLAVVYARSVDRAAGVAWRAVPLPPLAIGRGYRASDVPMTRTHAPRLVRVAVFLGLLSVGADCSFLGLFGLYSLRAGELALRQVAHNPSSATANFATALLPLVALTWMVLVASALVGSARASTKAFGRLLAVGIVGALGHALLGLCVLAWRRYLPMVLDRWSSRDEATAMVDTLWVTLLGAAAIGLVASVVMVMTAKLRRALP